MSVGEPFLVIFTVIEVAETGLLFSEFKEFISSFELADILRRLFKITVELF